MRRHARRAAAAKVIPIDPAMVPKKATTKKAATKKPAPVKKGAASAEPKPLKAKYPKLEILNYGEKPSTRSGKEDVLSPQERAYAKITSRAAAIKPSNVPRPSKGASAPYTDERQEAAYKAGNPIPKPLGLEQKQQQAKAAPKPQKQQGQPQAQQPARKKGLKLSRLLFNTALVQQAIGGAKQGIRSIKRFGGL